MGRRGFPTPQKIWQSSISRTSRRPCYSFSPNHFPHSPTIRKDDHARIDKLYALLQNTLSLENGLRLPKRADRFVALEQSESGDTLWAYFGKDFDCDQALPRGE